MTHQPAALAPAPVAAVSVGAVTRHLFAGQGLRIGRDPVCDLMVDDPRVSRIHATVWSDPGGTVVLEDLGSTNGTFVGDDRVTGCRVIGDVRLALGAPDGAQVAIIMNQVERPGPLAGHTVLVSSGQAAGDLEVSIGRAPDNTIVLDGTATSPTCDN